MDKAGKTIAKVLFAVLITGVITFPLLLIGTCFDRLKRSEARLTVRDGGWTRTVICEMQEKEIHEAWLDDIPEGARVIKTWEERRDTERVQTGTENVVTGTRDHDNGQVEEVYEERPVFEQRPVRDTRAEYETVVWKTSREISLSGHLEDTPAWPSFTLTEGEREKGRRESAYLELEGETDPRKPGLETSRYSRLLPDDLKRFRKGDELTVILRKHNGRILRIKE